MSNAHPTPYVPVELLGGRLVRVCPECKEQIGERTDDDGIVSNNFAEHYGAQHTKREPERQRGYVLALQPRDDGEPGPGPDAPTLDAAIRELGIPDQEVEELRAKTEARLAEAEAALRIA
jgi:hypothetical protein